MAEEYMAKVRAFVAEHAPEFHLHDQEAFLPCSAEWFLHHSSLWYVERNSKDKSRQYREFVAGHGDITPLRLAQEQLRYPPRRLVLELQPHARCGQRAEELDDIPLYVHVKEVENEAGLVEAFEINYCTLYAHNGPYPLGGRWLKGMSPMVGAHDGDWEHFTVRIDSWNGSLQGAWFNSHRPCDGEWVPAQELLRSPEGRPIVYVAKHGHGTYPRPGTYRRAYGFANDHTGSGGLVWRPKKLLLLPCGRLPDLVPSTSGIPLGLTPADVDAGRDPVGTHLTRVPSRGCILPKALSPPHDGLNRGLYISAAPQIPGKNGNVHGSSWSPSHGLHVEGAGANGQMHHTLLHASNGVPAPVWRAVEVVQEEVAWLGYRGNWGECLAPNEQGWWKTAECPVSRGGFLRAIGEFWPERKRL